ncbi:MAG: XrtA system polysaccharide deacetylase [Candidatus Eisenbacteria bacterium]
MKCMFSVDVEDWFHILGATSAPPISEWSSLPQGVRKNFMEILDILSRKQVRATCFFLGWVAEKYPDLVREAIGRGHEVASHGYGHRLVYEMTADQFAEDARRSKQAIEDIAGGPITGYRAPGFSATRATPWFYSKLIEAGYLYDSSVFPARREHGGLKTGNYAPYWITGNSGRLLEIPITIAEVLGQPLCFFGGGYLRLFPYAVVKMMALKVLKEGRPVVFYIHPRDIDPSQPRLPMGFWKRFKSYVNLGTTAGKVSRILDQLEFTTFEGFMSENGRLIGGL